MNVLEHSEVLYVPACTAQVFVKQRSAVMCYGFVTPLAHFSGSFHVYS